MFSRRGITLAVLPFPAAVLLFTAVAVASFFSPVFAAPSNISSRIDFGSDIFSPQIKIGDLDFQNLKILIETEPRNIPLHAHLLSTYVGKAVLGTKSLSESVAEVEKLLSFVLLRFDPQNSVTYFDRAYLFMLVANLGYQNFNSRTYSLMALCDMSTLIQMEPLNAYYHLFYTVIYASLKDHDISEFKLYDPLEELKKSLSFEVSDPQFHYIVGSTFQAISQNSTDVHQLAYAEFMQSIKMAPRNAPLKEKVFKTLIDLLTDYEQRKAQKPFWLEEAAYLYLIEKNQESAAAHNNLGYLYTMNNTRLDQALEHCKKAVSLDPSNPVFLDSLGCAYYKNRDLKKSIETLRKAYSFDPSSKDINEHLAEIYLQQNDNDSAIAHLKFLVGQDPQNALANNNYGYVLAEAGKNLEESLAHCRKATELEPQNAVYLDSFSWALFKNSKVTEAVEVIDRAIKIDPALGALYIHRGDMKFFEGKIAEASDDYVRGLQLDPAFPSAMTNFAYINAIRVLTEAVTASGKAVPAVLSVPGAAPFAYEAYANYYARLFSVLGVSVVPKPLKIELSRIQPPSGDTTPAEIAAVRATAEVEAGATVEIKIDREKK